MPANGQNQTPRKVRRPFILADSTCKDAAGCLRVHLQSKADAGSDWGLSVASYLGEATVARLTGSIKPKRRRRSRRRKVVAA
jgi:hypothetical protein